MLVSDIVRRNAMIFPDDDAFVAPGAATRTWRAVGDRTNRYANALADLGLTVGDRLAVLSPNRIEVLETHFACARAGVATAAVNIRLSADEIASYLTYTAPAAALVHTSLTGELLPVLESAAIQHVIGFGDAHGCPLDLESLLASAPPREPSVTVAEHDLYQLAATSGTTGVPKAVALTHRNGVAAMLSWAGDHPTAERQTYLPNLPFFFNPGGPAHLHPLILKGGRIVVLDAFEPAAVLEAIETHQVSHSIAVPTMLEMLLRHPDADRRDLSCLQRVIVGGAPISADLLERARTVLGDVLCPLYAMAETFSAGFILRPENQGLTGADRARLGSIGRPALLVEARVVREDGTDVPLGSDEAGEIWMRGDTIGESYFRMPEETAAARSDGWLRTGDMAVTDDEGFVTLVDRRKDMIITGGINVFSQEVETAIRSCPGVADVAVIGRPDPKWGEAVHAVVVATRPGLSPEDVLAWAAERLAGYKRPRSVDIVEELPRNANGKVLKRMLREQLHPA